jgi:hypothetical protein
MYSRAVVINLWSAAHNQVVRDCFHLLNKNNCDVTYKLVVRNLCVV